MLRSLYKRQTPITPRELLFTHRNITKKIRTYHYKMHASGKGSHATKNINIPKIWQKLNLREWKKLIDPTWRAHQKD